MAFREAILYSVQSSPPPRIDLDFRHLSSRDNIVAIWGRTTCRYEQGVITWREHLPYTSKTPPLRDLVKAM